MIRLFKNKSINQVTKITVVSTALIMVFLTGILFYNTYDEHTQELIKIEQEYLKSQKNLIKDETHRALRFIQYKYFQDTNTTDLDTIKGQIVETIENMRDIRGGSGYVFIYTYEGINIADPILKHNAGKNLIDFEDPNGKRVIKELIDISQQKEGGYVEYVWNKPTTNTLANKISYAISFEPFEWMLGSGVYLDDIQEVLQEKKKDYKKKITQYLVQIFLFVIALFFSSVAVSRYFTFLIQEDIENIRKTLKNISENYDTIDLNDVTFKEFSQISLNINQMIYELKELTENLELKVDQRTVELKRSEEFALDLVQKQDKFIKNAIHEINTPLSIIITNIDLFYLKHGENRYLNKIEAGSKIIHNIYNDLSYLVKKDRIKYPDSLIDFSQFLAQRIDFFEEIASGNMLRFESSIEENIFINFNETQLQRICDNTLSNAIKYSYEESSIIIALYKQKKSIILSIQNKGDTIKDSKILFERYYRKNDSRGGFGIGLNIIDEICKAKGVTIDVQSSDNITQFIYKFE